jgi:hypothetical protein
METRHVLTITAVTLLVGIALGMVIGHGYKRCPAPPDRQPTIDSLAIVADRAIQEAGRYAVMVDTLRAQREREVAARAPIDTVRKVVRARLRLAPVPAIAAALGLDSSRVRARPDSTVEGVTVADLREIATDREVVREQVRRLEQDTTIAGRIERGLTAEVLALRGALDARNAQVDSLSADKTDLKGALADCEIKSERRRGWAAIGKVGTAIVGVAAVVVAAVVVKREVAP